MVGEHQRRRAGAALAAVDGDEVDAAPGGLGPHRQRLPEAQLADRRLDADRQPGGVGDRLDQLEQPVDVGERGVERRALAVDADGDASDGGDLGGDLGAGQHAARGPAWPPG